MGRYRGGGCELGEHQPRWHVLGVPCDLRELVREWPVSEHTCSAAPA